MEMSTAARALDALSQPSRLEVFRWLVREAPRGLPAGVLAERTATPASTLSFHLKHLVSAGLVRSQRHGRSICYSLDDDALRELFWFLGEDCCQGRTELCPPFTERIDARVAEADDRTTPTVLFLCSHNSARSQIAEALLRHKAGDRFVVHSAGLRPAGIDPMTFEVLDEVGIDATGLRSQDLGEFLGKVPIHHAIVVCEAADADCPKLHPFAKYRTSWPFPDPVAATGSIEERRATFRRVRDAIDARLDHWLVHELPSLGGERTRGAREA
ncbi:MAG: metalloregulator ArsR/SmtB family transcription factor [Planctomycetes bacterium]|nr:metalloregulator ArsR/SmtB family transcription factor [Planctomycetota bacterium]